MSGGKKGRVLSLLKVSHIKLHRIEHPSPPPTVMSHHLSKGITPVKSLYASITLKTGCENLIWKWGGEEGSGGGGGEGVRGGEWRRMGGGGEGQGLARDGDGGGEGW